MPDFAKYKNSENAFIIIANWMRLRSTIEFLGLWEQIHNPNFKGLEFDAFKNESGSNAFTLSPQKWISPEFKLYIIKDYQRLKKDEAERKAIGWDEKRALSKINYHIHTDAVQKYLITDELTSMEKGYYQRLCYS